MKRRCPHCRKPTIGIGALFHAENKNKPARCGNCGADIRSHGVGSRTAAITGWVKLVNVDALLIVLPQIAVVTCFDVDRSLGALIAALTASALLLHLIRLVAPLQVVVSPIWGYRKPIYSKLDLAQAVLVILLWSALISLIATVAEPAITPLVWPLI